MNEQVDENPMQNPARPLVTATSILTRSVARDAETRQTMFGLPAKDQLLRSTPSNWIAYCRFEVCGIEQSLPVLGGGRAPTMQ
jgi:hypothetical protein